MFRSFGSTVSGSSSSGNVYVNADGEELVTKAESDANNAALTQSLGVVQTAMNATQIQTNADAATNDYQYFSTLAAETKLNNTHIS